MLNSSLIKFKEIKTSQIQVEFNSGGDVTSTLDARNILILNTISYDKYATISALRVASDSLYRFHCDTLKNEKALLIYVYVDM